MTHFTVFCVGNEMTHTVLVSGVVPGHVDDASAPTYSDPRKLWRRYAVKVTAADPTNAERKVVRQFTHPEAANNE